MVLFYLKPTRDDGDAVHSSLTENGCILVATVVSVVPVATVE